MPQRCIGCQAELPEEVNFCTQCGCDELVDSVSATRGFAKDQPVAPEPLATAAQIPTQSCACAQGETCDGSSSNSCGSRFIAPLPAAAPLSANTSKVAMDDHEFKESLASLTRGLLKDEDQLRKIRAAASAHHFTCAQASQLIAVVKGHPGEALVTLYPALVDATVDNFSRVLMGMKWIEERQEAIAKLKLDAGQYATVLKK